MKLMSQVFFITMFASITHAAIFERAEWGAAEPDEKNLVRHPDGIKLIVIGHTVTKVLGNSAATVKTIQTSHMKKHKWADIAYHCVFGLDGKCYRGRALEYIPALVKNHNSGMCAVGMEGCYENDPPPAQQFDLDIITAEDLPRLAQQLALVARECGFKKLVWGENIKLQSEIAPDKFPVSPGQHVKDLFQDWLDLTNQLLL